MSFGEPSLLHHPRSSMRVWVKRRQERQLNRSTSGSRSRPEILFSWFGSRGVKRSDLASPGTGGDVGPAVSAHLPDEPRPDLTQDGSPVQVIIPEFGNGVVHAWRGGEPLEPLRRCRLAPPERAVALLEHLDDHAGQNLRLEPARRR